MGLLKVVRVGLCGPDASSLDICSFAASNCQYRCVSLKVCGARTVLAATRHGLEATADRLIAWSPLRSIVRPLAHTHTPQPHWVCTKTTDCIIPSPSLVTTKAKCNSNPWLDRVKSPLVSCMPLFSTYPLVWIVPVRAPVLLSIQHLHSFFFFLEVVFQTFGFAPRWQPLTCQIGG